MGWAAAKRVCRGALPMFKVQGPAENIVHRRGAIRLLSDICSAFSISSVPQARQSYVRPPLSVSVVAQHVVVMVNEVGTAAQTYVVNHCV